MSFIYYYFQYLVSYLFLIFKNFQFNNIININLRKLKYYSYKINYIALLL